MKLFRDKLGDGVISLDNITEAKGYYIDEIERLEDRIDYLEDLLYSNNIDFKE